MYDFDDCEQVYLESPKMRLIVKIIAIIIIVFIIIGISVFIIIIIIRTREL